MMNIKKIFSLFLLFLYSSSIIPVVSAQTTETDQLSGLSPINNIESNDTPPNDENTKEASTPKTSLLSENDEEVKKENKQFVEEMDAAKTDVDAMNVIDTWVREEKFVAERTKNKEFLYHYNVLSNGKKICHKDVFILKDKTVIVLIEDIIESNDGKASLLEDTTIPFSYHLEINKRNTKMDDFYQFIASFLPDVVKDKVIKVLDRVTKVNMDIEGKCTILNKDGKTYYDIFIKKYFVYPSKYTTFYPNISSHISPSSETGHIYISLTQINTANYSLSNVGADIIFNECNIFIDLNLIHQDSKLAGLKKYYRPDSVVSYGEVRP